MKGRPDQDRMSLRFLTVFLLIGLGSVAGCDAGGVGQAVPPATSESSKPRIERVQGKLSIWNKTSEETVGDIIVEIVYSDSRPGASLLPPKVRRINLGNGLSVVGYHDVGKVSLRTTVSPGNTFLLEDIEITEAASVDLILNDDGFKFR